VATLLFVDVLGVRQRWARGGAEAAKELFDRFYGHVVAAARPESGMILDGAVESDSAALVCDTPAAALRIAQRLFRRVFDSVPARKAPDPDQMWLRGALVPYPAGQTLRNQRGFPAPLQHIQGYTYAPDLLNAIAVEKSGFRGMRLLVRDELVSANLRTEFRMTFGGWFFIPFRRLKHSQYPQARDGAFQDFLWMVDESDDVWESRKRTMAYRLRTAARDSEELAQAAATQIVFHECAAVLASIRKRIPRRSAKV
jgi:hypothetical protein